jgi:hypothetical protein
LTNLEDNFDKFDLKEKSTTKSTKNVSNKDIDDLFNLVDDTSSNPNSSDFDFEKYVKNSSKNSNKGLFD